MEPVRALRQIGPSTRAGLGAGTNPAKEPCCTTPQDAHLVGQGWELQLSTSGAGFWATALHRAGGSVLKKPSWVSTQCTSCSRTPPPQDTLHGLKSPVVQLRRKGTEHQARGQVPQLAQGHWMEGKQVCLADPDEMLPLVWSRPCVSKLLFQDQPWRLPLTYF